MHLHSRSQTDVDRVERWRAARAAGSARRLHGRRVPTTPLRPLGAAFASEEGHVRAGGLVECPVCEMVIDASASRWSSRTAEGTVHFCTPTCKAAFDRVAPA